MNDDPQITKNQDHPATVPDNVPRFFPFCGVLFGAITLIFFMGLVVAAIFDKQVPQGAKFNVVVVLAVGTALSTTFLGGTAAVKGTLRLPFVEDSPMAFAAGGGIAVLIVVLVFGWYLYAAPIHFGGEGFLQGNPPFDVEVVYDGTDGVNLRSYPTTTNSTNIIAALLKGSRLTAKAGPTEAERNRWWQVEVDPGWIAETCTSNGPPCIRSVESSRDRS